jgi:diaminopimelate epimerase
MSTSFSFSKMHGLGNDFIVIDGIRQELDLTEDLLRQMADRHLGIGADQILVALPPTKGGDFTYRMYNADGTMAGQCGNGARCFARFVVDKGLTAKRELVLETLTRNIHTTLHENHSVTVNMGPPVFEAAAVPFTTAIAITNPVALLGQVYDISVLSMGNPHAVITLEDIAAAPVTTLGPLLQQHPLFPDRVNVGFMKVKSSKEIDLRVYERGAGETMACGTGACAAAVAGIRRGLLDQEVTVNLAGGQLTITWQGDSTPVWMTGPTAHVFDGVWQGS